MGRLGLGKKTLICDEVWSDLSGEQIIRIRSGTCQLNNSTYSYSR